MQGIVSLLDDEHYEQVKEIWAELEERFNVHGLYVTPFPHLSYQVAEAYDMEATTDLLHEVAQNTSPFQIKTAGLGIFTIARPVLYIPVVRGPELSALHRRLWNQVAQYVTGRSAYYQPDMWMPHITLAQGDVDGEKLSEIVRAFSNRSFHWEVSINNLSFIYDTGTKQGLRCRFNFNGNASQK